MSEVHYDRILIPLDGSERAEEALPVARELAGRFQSRLYLLVAFNLTGRLFTRNSGPIPSHYAKLRQFEHDQIGGFLKEHEARLAAEGVDVQSLIIENDPADAIVTACEEHGVNLVVMTSHGQRGWTRWITGSTTESVLRRAPCPVLVLRQATATAGSRT